MRRYECALAGIITLRTVVIAEHHRSEVVIPRCRAGSQIYAVLVVGFTAVFACADVILIRSVALLYAAEVRFVGTAAILTTHKTGLTAVCAAENGVACLATAASCAYETGPAAIVPAVNGVAWRALRLCNL